MTLIFIGAIWMSSSRLNGMACVLISVVCASYCIGRGIDEFGRGGTTPGWRSPEFIVLMVAIAFLGNLGLLNFEIALVSMVGCMASYNLGRGLAKHYRSKVSTVFNR